MGGGDKTKALVGAVRVLDHLLGDLPPGWPVCCVGEPRPTVRPVRWTREQPPGGGPVAAMAAGLRALDERGAAAGTTVTLVLAGDQPFAGSLAERLVTTLHDRPSDVDAVAAVGARPADRPAGVDAPPAVAAGDHDPRRREQLLLAAYRTDRLRAVLARAAASGAGVYATLGVLRVETLAAQEALLLDVDTPEALREARRRVRDGV